MENLTDTGPSPYLLALLLCDNIVSDPYTGKPTLIGIFSHFRADKFPMQFQTSIYARFIDAEGKYNFRIEYAQVETNIVLSQAKFQDMKIPDRLEPFDFITRTPVLSIPKPGKYEFRLYANDKYIGRAFLTAEQTIRSE